MRNQLFERRSGSREKGNNKTSGNICFAFSCFVFFALRVKVEVCCVMRRVRRNARRLVARLTLGGPATKAAAIGVAAPANGGERKVGSRKRGRSAAYCSGRARANDQERRLKKA